MLFFIKSVDRCTQQAFARQLPNALVRFHNITNGVDYQIWCGRCLQLIKKPVGFVDYTWSIARFANFSTCWLLIWTASVLALSYRVRNKERWGKYYSTSLSPTWIGLEYFIKILFNVLPLCSAILIELIVANFNHFNM